MTDRADAPLEGPDPRLGASLKAVAIAGATLTLGGVAVAGPIPAISVAFGAAIAVINLWVLARVVAALLPRDAGVARAQSRAGWALVAALKMAGLFAVLWVALSRGLVSPLAKLAGFGALPIGIAIGSLVSDRSASSSVPRRPGETSGGAPPRDGRPLDGQDGATHG
jgi:hypothetical protein